MIKNVRNIRLVAILGLLVIIYGGLKLFKNTGRSSAFKEELVLIDTSKVSKIVLFKGGNSFDVSRAEYGWEVSIGNNKKVEATSSNVQNALGTLLRIKPDRIATRDPEKWKDYQVDSSGTRVTVFEGSKKSLDLIIGRFGVHGRQQFHTFVRLEGDDEVYAANDFMGISFPSDPGSYRNSKVLEVEIDSIQSITFNYPADTAFILTKSLNGWNIGPRFADSAQVESYISSLRYVSNTNFNDEVEPAALINPTLKVEINYVDGTEPVVFEAFSHPLLGLIVHSSTNPASYFSDENLVERLFVGANQLLTAAEE